MSSGLPILRQPWLSKQAGDDTVDLTHVINLLHRYWMKPELLGGFQPTAFIFTLDQGRKSNLVGVYRGDGVCILTRNADEGRLRGGQANISASNALL